MGGGCGPAAPPPGCGVQRRGHRRDSARTRRVEPLVSRCVHPCGRATRPSARGRDLGRRSLVALTDEPLHGTRAVLRRESRGRSRMVNALAIGLLAGVGIILIVTGFAPAPTPLASEIAAL